MSNPDERREKLLRNALKGNGVFSTLSGIAFIAAAGPIADRIGLAYPWVLMVIGASLLIFAVGLFRNATATDLNLLEARIAVALDFAWVLGSVVVVALGILSTTGNWGVAIVADIVLVFAIAQAIGVRRIQSAA